MTLAHLLLTHASGCRSEQDAASPAMGSAANRAGASASEHGPAPGKAPPCADGRTSCGRACCLFDEQCIDNRCHCDGMVCGDRCRPRLVSCAVVVRSQFRDNCYGGPAAIACGPRKPGPDLDVCDIGVVNRELVESLEACDAATFRALTAEACQAYRKKNAGRPLDEFDPDHDIWVTRHLDRFDAGGSLLDGQELTGEFRCPRPNAGRARLR
jgi:hypothetical protein